ncbi:MAG: diacylglycerol kinase family protein [Thermodesulfobacteriota bacterium]|nr:diacylglycerol kinase family protein [Thermodesulfobacteriota bacterium]
MPPRRIIILNSHANNGQARKKWKAVAPVVMARLSSKGGKPPEVVDSPVNGLTEMVGHFAKDGQCTIIAAGGDGTVSHCANAILAQPEADKDRFVLGAIGLGSSNDFHKPFERDKCLGRVPVRIDDHRPIKHNAGLVIYDAGEEKRRRFFVVNASMGVVAEGNLLFNKGDAMIRRLKPLCVSAAINYTAIKAIGMHKNIEAAITVANEQHPVKMTNLGVVINPHFTGSCRYDTPVSPQSDHMCVNLLENLNRRQLLGAFYYFGKGRFLGRPGARSWRVEKASAIPAGLAALEIDGEVETTTAAHFILIKEALSVCQ